MKRFSKAFSFGILLSLLTVTPLFLSELEAATQAPELKTAKITPFAVFQDQLPGATVTVEAEVIGGSNFKLYVKYFSGWFGDTQNYVVSELMYDDGTHGDKIGGDNIWTTQISLNMNISKLRLYNEQVDYLKLWIEANDNSGNFISFTNPIDPALEVGILKRSNKAVSGWASGSIVYTDHAVNIKFDNFKGLGDTPLVAKEFFKVFPDSFDFLTFFTAGKITAYGIPSGGAVQNNIKGINMLLYDNSPLWGSSGRLRNDIYQNNDVIAREFLHEFGHGFGIYLNNANLDIATPPGGGGIHWGTSDIIGQMRGGYFLKKDPSGNFLVTNRDNFDSNSYFHHSYADLELYLMGLLPEEEVRTHYFLKDKFSLPPLLSTVPSTDIVEIAISDIINVYGPRVPSYASAQKNFYGAFIIVSDTFVNQAEISLINTIAKYYASSLPSKGVVTGGLFPESDPPSFSAATAFRGTMITAIAPPINQIALELACPASVKVNQSLTVKVNLYNRDCHSSVRVDRFIMSVVGNSNGTLSGLGIFGPYNRSLGTPKEVPPAICDTTTTPGIVTPFNLTVMNAVPVSLSNKMAIVDVEAITDKGQTFGGGDCVVNIVP
ncbi:MAG: hypothetical protein OEW04_01100 [Nitrospirota bacterium]|nr:hypothetical protein [Nitrospirota bacterium]